MFSKNKSIPIIGLMSGTSMDSIDSVMINTDGNNVTKKYANNETKYSKKTSSLLFNAFKNIDLFLQNKDDIEELEYKVTIDHARAANDLMSKTEMVPKLIGFHGQTIFHSSKISKTYQIGNGQLLSDLLKINVISNFRNNDMSKGGQGAPLAPIYHKFLIEIKKLKLPSCFINIGGISNISYYDGKNLIGFDIGPGNGLMDSFIQKYFNKKFDDKGFMASQGQKDEGLVKIFFKNNFFNENYPKSLDRNDFNEFFKFLELSKISKKNVMATLAEITLQSIIKSIEILPQIPNNIILVGGGTYNINLVNKIKTTFGKMVLTSDEIGLESKSIESELIAFLAARTLYKLPITFPKTTGVKNPTKGGVLYPYSSDLDQIIKMH